VTTKCCPKMFYCINDFTYHGNWDDCHDLVDIRVPFLCTQWGKKWEDNRKFELYFEFNRRASIGLDSSRVLSKAPTAPAWPSCRRNTACKCNRKQEKVLGAAFIRFSAGNLANDQFISLLDKTIAWLQPWLVSRWHWYNAKIVGCQDGLYLI